MNTEESRVKHRGRTMMARLFLPWTWLGWLGLIGLIMFLASGFVPVPYRGFLILTGCAVLIGAVVAYFWPDRREGQRLWVLRACFSVLGAFFVGVSGVMWGGVIFPATIFFGTWALAALVTSGSLGSFGFSAFAGSWVQFGPRLFLGHHLVFGRGSAAAVQY